MRYCQRCFYHEAHPLYLTFDDKGICSGCRVHEEKDEINWSDKEAELGRLFESFRNTKGRNYDCVIPVSGAADSFFIVHVVKNLFKMNPLLVTYNKHYNTAVGVRNLAKLRIVFDCDIMTMTIDPEKVKKITRATFRKFGSIYWHCIAGQTVFPVQIAVKFKIPLIVWGAHQGVDQVGMFSHHDKVEMTRKYRKEHDLMGYEADDLIDSEIDFITENDIRQFRYPEDKEIEKIGVRGIYLNNYIRWDSRTQHEEMIRLYDYESANQTRTFDRYNNIDCWNYSDVHDYIKLQKHGYGKVVDHAVRELRLGQLDHKKGLEMINHYILKEPENLDLFCKWLGITRNAFFYILNQHRNPVFWQRNGEWEWEYISRSYEKVGEEGLIRKAPYSDFIQTKKGTSSDSESDYILIGKGK